MIENQLSEKEGEILLYGYVGTSLGGINGEAIAQQIDAFNAEGKEQITIRINSYGGSVAEGWMILAAMQRSQAQITAVIDGIAASIAGIIAIAADYTIMADYALFMTHRASSMSEEPDQDKLDKFTEAIKVIFMKRLNKSADEVSAFFGDSDRWLSATEALEHGLINEVIQTEARDLVEQAQEILNRTQTEVMKAEEVYNVYSKTPKKKMNEEVLNMLSLPAESAEADVLNAIKGMKETIDSLKAEVVNKSNEVSEKTDEVLNLTAKVKAFEDKEKEARYKEISEVINAAVDAGKIKATAKEAFIKLAENDLNSVKEALNAMAVPVKISSLIQVEEKPYEYKSIEEQVREAQNKK